MRLQTLCTKVAHGSLLSLHIQESLSGTARVHLIVNVSPSDTSVHETFSSLLFGQRAMAVTVSPVRPTGVDTLLAQLVLLHTPHHTPHNPQAANVEIDYKAMALLLQRQLDAMLDRQRTQNRCGTAVVSHCSRHLLTNVPYSMSVG